MKRILKSLLKKTAIAVSKTLALFFYDKKYITGRWFTESDDGWFYILRSFYWQKVLRVNSRVPFPIHPGNKISKFERIHFHPDDLNNFQNYGIYFQNFDADIYIGKGSYIAPNVGLITSNHDPLNPDKHLKGEDIVIGEKCWLGMNSVILPGVQLGDNTVVAAGAVVTKSFEEGNCIIGGVPAKVIKKII